VNFLDRKRNKEEKEREGEKGHVEKFKYKNPL